MGNNKSDINKTNNKIPILITNLPNDIISELTSNYFCPYCLDSVLEDNEEDYICPKCYMIFCYCDYCCISPIDKKDNYNCCIGDEYACYISGEGNNKNKESNTDDKDVKNNNEVSKKDNSESGDKDKVMWLRLKKWKFRNKIYPAPYVHIKHRERVILYWTCDVCKRYKQTSLGYDYA